MLGIWIPLEDFESPWKNQQKNPRTPHQINQENCHEIPKRSLKNCR
jgi:hypothetical protein